MEYRINDPVLEIIRGAIICIIDGDELSYESAKDLAKATFSQKYFIVGIESRENFVVLTLKSVIENDLTEPWARKQMSDTGMDISFF